MMDERRIEAALRAQPPDEPKYRGNVASVLRGRATEAGRGESPPGVLEFVELAPRRQLPSPALFGAVAAGVVLIVALAVVARPQEPPSATTPMPTTAPSPSIIPVGLPTELVGRWVGATPEAVATPNRAAPAFVVFGEDRVALEHLAGGIVKDFNSRVTVTADGLLRLSLTDQMGRCDAGSTGDYRWTLSPRASTLTLEAVSDECPNRAAAFGGTWTHTVCPERGSDCLGPLEAGRYASVNFDPFGSHSYGEVAYDVTDDWSSTLDDTTRLTLLPPDGGGPGVHGLYLFADVAATAPDCSATVNDGIGSQAIAAALSATPGLTVTTSAATVGAYQARTLDLSAAATLACDGEQPILTSRVGSAVPWTLAIGQDQNMRIVLVDLPGDRTMAVVAASDRSASEYTQLIGEATSVIDSFVLSTTP